MGVYRYVARARYRLETLLARICFVAPWWPAYTCSLKSNDPKLKSSLVDDTHVQLFFIIMGAYFARLRCRLKTRFA